ncbi:MAG: glycoside hydrolase family 43 protein [Acidimicrobiales bacterium]
MTYRNPVIPGFHPDPSVCRAGRDYFLATSSFTYVPGVPVFHSPNLADWTQIGNALERPSQLDLTATADWSSGGIFAPTLRHHDGRFWLITTNVGSRGARTFLLTSDDPAGPWSDPVPVPVPGIDPDLAWDGDGNCWVHFSGRGGITRCRIDPSSGTLLSPPEATWSGTGQQFPEAPHLFERGGTWYLLIAEGGTERGHCVSIARGPSPTGPWEGAPANPILTHRSTDRPIQNTGHADLVEAADGSWWMVLLGVRPVGVTPGFHVLGRETYLTPLEWRDGWPVPAEVSLDMHQAPPGPAEPVRAQGRDDFEAPMLAPGWVSVRRPPAAMASLRARPGWLVLAGGEATLDSPDPVFVGRRQQHHRCRVRARLEAGSAVEAGITLYMDGTAHYEVGVRGDRIVARSRIGPVDAVLAAAPSPGGPVVLTLETGPHPHGPDSVSLGFESARSAPHTLVQIDGRYLSTEVTGGFLGRTIGMYAVGGDAAFDWFDYEGT